MMLTKKGSTRGTVSVLFLSALIFLVARYAVNAIELSMPNNSGMTIAWKPITDILKDEKATVMVVDDVDSKPVSDAKVLESKVIDDHSEANLREAKKILDSQPKGNSKSDKTPAATSPETLKKKIKKRFALEKIFPDNVDGLPVLIFFADDGSALSQKMETTSFGIKQIREKIEKEYYPIKIRFDKKMSKTEYRLYQEYGSTAVPVVHIVTATGESLVYNSGYISAIKVMVLLHNAERKQEKLEEQADEKTD